MLEYYGEDSLIVVQVTSVISVVAMMPFHEWQGLPARFFLVEKFALGVIDTGTVL